MSILTTNTGRTINLLDPDPDQITLEDIANNLTHICRFNGQLKHFYSVAQHSIYVASLVPSHLKLQALLHDSAEAYICDIPTPLKALLQDYEVIETRLLSVIGDKFGVNLTHLHPTVKEADRIMVVTERDNLRENKGTHNWGDEYENSIRHPFFDPPADPDPIEIKAKFLKEVQEYTE